MKKTIAIYSIGIAIAAYLLQWLEYQYAVRLFSTEIYIVIIAIAFAALGVWVGRSLTARGVSKPFEKNEQAINYLGINRKLSRRTRL